MEADIRDDYPDFDDWFDSFVDEVRALGYRGPIDKYAQEEVYEDNVWPDEAAQDFVDEMNS